MRAAVFVVAALVWLAGPEGAGERAEERALMVQRQIEHPSDGRLAVSDKAV